MKYFIFSVILMFAGNSFSQQQLYINEVMGDNNNVIESGSYDWIELYNPNGNIVNLNGWYLSDDPKNPQKWKFPKAKIQANSFFTIHLSGVKSKSKKEVHANFKLDANGEILLLSNSKGLIIDCFQSIPCSKGISYGRCNDGSLSFERFLKPTKQKSNNSSNGILFSHQPGFYNYFFELELKSKQGDSIRYTEDGSLPNQHSKLYRSKININSRQDQIDTLTQLSNNRTSNRNTKSIKGYVIRAATFKKGKRSSKIYSKSYFTFPKITDKYKGFNVVSLITDQNNLFQKDTGIYIGNEVSSNANYNSSLFPKKNNYFKVTFSILLKLIARPIFN